MNEKKETLSRQFVAAIAGFLVAPVVAVIALIVIEAARGDFAFTLSELFGWSLLLYGYCLFVTVAFAVPIFLLLNHFNRISLLSTVCAGAFTGVVASFAFDALNPYVIIPVGCVSAIFFWLIWRFNGRSSTNLHG